MGKKKSKIQEDQAQTTIKNAPFPKRPGRPGRRKASKLGDLETNFYDASNFYANEYKNYILFTSVISGNAVKFKAFLTAFEDQFKSDWNSEQVYGRNDPIQTFKNTTRTISLAWDCPAASFSEAKSNMIAAATLVRMLYPSYQRTGNVSTIKKSPLIKVKFRNLIKSAVDATGLLVTIDGFNFSPEIEAGWFDRDEAGQGDLNEDELIPKLLKFSCNMTVLHRQTIGHDTTDQWSTALGAFPNLPEAYASESSFTEDQDFKFEDDQKFIESQNKFNKEELEEYHKAIGSKAAAEIPGDGTLSDEVSAALAGIGASAAAASAAATGAGVTLSALTIDPPPEDRSQSIFEQIANWPAELVQSFESGADSTRGPTAAPISGPAGVNINGEGGN